MVDFEAEWGQSGKELHVSFRSHWAPTLSAQADGPPGHSVNGRKWPVVIERVAF